jgi:PAS domain S-box-containing protein
MRYRNSPFAVFAAMAVVLIVSVSAIYVMGVLTLQRTRHVVQHQVVIDHLQSALTTLVDAETGQRGYLLTGDDQYLQPYHDAVERIHGEIDLLRGLAGGGELDQSDINKLVDLSNHKLRELDHTIDVRRSDGLDAALAIVRSGEGRVTMEAIRAHIRSLADQQRAELREAHRTADRFTYYRTGSFCFMTLLNLAFLAWAYGRIQAEMRGQDQTEHELRRQKDLTTVTLASIGDAVIVTDNTARVTFMNPVAEALTGWKLAEAERQPLTTIFRIINEQSRQTVENPVEKVLRLGSIVGLANHTLLIRRDGSEVPIDDGGAPIRDEHGQVHGVVLVFRDFTEYKEAEHKLIAAKRDAEAASRAKDQFLAALSHELRTPLTPVLATLTNWEGSARFNAEDQNDLTMLRRNIELEARLIDDLLDLTRIAKGKIQLNNEVVDMHDLLRSVQGICQSEINAKHLYAEMHLEASRHHVNADSARMQQVFWNILRNAAKFSDEGGRVDIRTSDDPDGRVRVTILDEGIGMTQETMDRLFQPFEQGQDDIVKRYGGLGLGMAISKALVDVQGGTIDAQSEGEGKGARFSVTMPTVTAPTSARPAAPDQRQSCDGKEIRILLVEDHVDTARAMSRLLRSLGHQVETAATIRSALEMADGDHFQLIISDIGLPDGTGIDFIRQVRQRSSVPAIALTGFGREDDIARSREAGFTVHLTKPVNFQKLELIVQQVASDQS